MQFDKQKISEIILNTYTDSWYIWVGIFILGLLLFLYSEKISISKRDKRKKEDSGAGLMALSIVIHLGIIWAWM